MKICGIKCNGHCKRLTYILSEEGFAVDGLDGVYLCPICKDRAIRQILSPTEILPPKITIIKEGNHLSVTLGKPKAAAVVGGARQGEEVPLKQLPGPGLRDDKLGEGAPAESSKSSLDGFMEFGRKSPYEEEVSQYLGLPCKFTI
jgi:hypothetical protein